MPIERTLSIIKPGFTHLADEINALFEQAGLRIVAKKHVPLPREQAKDFYPIHQGRPFYDGLVNYRVPGRGVVRVREGENATARTREIRGAPAPAMSAAGTIRW